MLFSRVGRNAIAGSGASAIYILLSLITTPILLHALGVTAYGALAVIGSLTAYIGIFDFGIGGSLGRFMTIYEEQGDEPALAGLVTFAFLFYASIATVLFPTIYWSAPVIGNFLSFPTSLTRELPALLMMLLSIFFASSLSGILNARLASIHRLDIGAYVGMGASIASAIAIIIFVPSFPSLYVVFACNLGQIILSSFGAFISFIRLTGRSPLPLGRFTFNQMRRLLSFGIWSQLSGITAIVNLEADKVIISRYLGVANVSPYQVANRIALLSRIFPLQLIGAMLPELTARITSGLAPLEIEALYTRSSRSLMLATMFISGFVIGAADSILRFWLGARLPWAAELCAALVLSYVVNNATGVGTTIVKAQGRPQLETTYGVISAVLNITCTLTLIRPLGLFGVVAGTIIGNLVGSLYFLAAFHRRTGISWWRSMGRWLCKLSLMMTVGIVVALLTSRYAGYGEVSRLRIIPGLFITGVLYVISFAVAGYYLRFWLPEDYIALKRLNTVIKSRIFPS